MEASFGVCLPRTVHSLRRAYRKTDPQIHRWNGTAQLINDMNVQLCSCTITVRIIYWIFGGTKAQYRQANCNDCSFHSVNPPIRTMFSNNT